MLYQKQFKPNKMKLETRTTKSFINIKVDEIETTIFSSSEEEINTMINNLISVAIELTSYTEKNIHDYIHKFED